jgi:hypothetical protein
MMIDARKLFPLVKKAGLYPTVGGYINGVESSLRAGGRHIKGREIQLLLSKVKIELHHAVADLDKLRDDEQKRRLHCESYQPAHCND